jgi:hypothetical protein
MNFIGMIYNKRMARKQNSKAESEEIKKETMVRAITSNFVT